MGTSNVAQSVRDRLLHRMRDTRENYQALLTRYTLERLLHRLGLFDELGRSLKTTNCIENLNGQVDRRLGKVKRWQHSLQRHQWMALALIETETRMRRLTGYEHLPKLQEALKDAIPDQE